MKDKELKLLTMDQLRSHVAALDREIVAVENRAYKMRYERRRANKHYQPQA